MSFRDQFELPEQGSLWLAPSPESDGALPAATKSNPLLDSVDSPPPVIEVELPEGKRRFTAHSPSVLRSLTRNGSATDALQWQLHNIVKEFSAPPDGDSPPSQSPGKAVKIPDIDSVQVIEIPPLASESSAGALECSALYGTPSTPRGEAEHPSDSTSARDVHSGSGVNAEDLSAACSVLNEFEEEGAESIREVLTALVKCNEALCAYEDEDMEDDENEELIELQLRVGQLLGTTGVRNLLKLLHNSDRSLRCAAARLLCAFTAGNPRNQEVLQNCGGVQEGAIFVFAISKHFHEQYLKCNEMATNEQLNWECTLDHAIAFTNFIKALLSSNPHTSGSSFWSFPSPKVGGGPVPDPKNHLLGFYTEPLSSLPEDQHFAREEREYMQMFDLLKRFYDDRNTSLVRHIIPSSTQPSHSPQRSEDDIIESEVLESVATETNVDEYVEEDIPEDDGTSDGDEQVAHDVDVKSDSDSVEREAEELGGGEIPSSRLEAAIQSRENELQRKLGEYQKLRSTIDSLKLELVTLKQLHSEKMRLESARSSVRGQHSTRSSVHESDRRAQTARGRIQSAMSATMPRDHHLRRPASAREDVRYDQSAAPQHDQHISAYNVSRSPYTSLWALRNQQMVDTARLHQTTTPRSKKHARHRSARPSSAPAHRPQKPLVRSNPKSFPAEAKPGQQTSASMVKPLNLADVKQRISAASARTSSHLSPLLSSTPRRSSFSSRSSLSTSSLSRQQLGSPRGRQRSNSARSSFFNLLHKHLRDSESTRVRIDEDSVMSLELSPIALAESKFRSEASKRRLSTSSAELAGPGEASGRGNWRTAAITTMERAASFRRRFTAGPRSLESSVSAKSMYCPYQPYQSQGPGGEDEDEESEKSSVRQVHTRPGTLGLKSEDLVFQFQQSMLRSPRGGQSTTKPVVTPSPPSTRPGPKTPRHNGVVVEPNASQRRYRKLVESGHLPASM